MVDEAVDAEKLLRRSKVIAPQFDLWRLTSLGLSLCTRFRRSLTMRASIPGYWSTRECESPIARLQIRPVDADAYACHKAVSRSTREVFHILHDSRKKHGLQEVCLLQYGRDRALPITIFPLVAGAPICSS